MSPTCRECNEPITEGQMFMAERDTDHNVWVARHDTCVTKYSQVTDKRVWQMNAARAWVLTKEITPLPA